MRFGSVCAGIEAASVAWLPLGWTPGWYSEIDLHACSVLQERHSCVPNLGDMMKLKGESVESVELLVGGTPCQSFSLAGLRKGLDDDRGNLAFEFCRLASELRPRWLVWENVPGVLSLDKGRAFGSILGALAEIGYGFAYRVLDSQWVRVQSHPRAVPQRRRRVFVVGYIGDWRRAAAVLLERESLHGHPPPRREAGQAVAGTLGARTSRSVGVQDAECGHLIAAPSLTAKAHNADQTGREGLLITADVAPTINAHFGTKQGLENQHIDGGAGLFIRTGRESALVASSAIRRITPREAERLMGFPDDYTLVEHRGKPMADGPRYRLLGNSMAVNVMRWIGERIQMVDEILTEPER